MTHGEAIKDILKEKNMTMAQLARVMGKTLRLVSDRVNTVSNISVKNLEEMLNVLDYKIVIMPKNGKLPKGAYEIGVSHSEVEE